MPIEELVAIYERVTQDGSTVFGHVAGVLSRELILTAMNLQLTPSCQHLRLSLTLPLAEAMKMHRAAHKDRLDAPEWIMYLLQQSIARDLSPIGSPKANQESQ